MSDILIKNVPAKVHKKLKEMAEYHHRSMTKEALVLLEEAAAHYSVEASPASGKEGMPSKAKKEIEERRRRAKEMIEKMRGLGSGKMTTDEVMKLTRGE